MTNRIFLSLLAAMALSSCAGTDTPRPGAYPPGQTMSTPQPGGATMGGGF